MKAAVSSSFGAWLKKRRKSFDLTQVELAEQVDCAVITIQKIEANQRRPSKATAERLAVRLNIAVNDIPAFIRFARAGTGAMSEVSPGGGPPPWRKFQHQPTNLPALLTPLIGREAEVAKVRRRLVDEGARLLTLVGPPGVGKTSLAIQAAGGLLDAFEAGVFFVSLAELRDARLVPAAVASALGVNRIQESSFSERLKEYLYDKQLLLVMDNFEHVLAAAPLLGELMAACRWLSFLVTSRVALSIRGERQFPVAPLAVPGEDWEELPVEALLSWPAVALFAARAQDAQPDFALTSYNAGAVVAICRRLDGLPLAIELAAARAGLLAPEDLLEQMNGPRFLRAEGPRDANERHRTLYQAIDWSWAQLNFEEQRLLAWLSVFAGGWTLQSAALQMGNTDKPAVAERLMRLLSHNLVMRSGQAAPWRFRMLETVRDYALNRLEALGETVQARQRQAEIMLALAEAAGPHLRDADQLAWIEQLEAEKYNLREALSWYLDTVHDAEQGLRLTGALSWYWNIRSALGEGRFWLDKALQAASNLESPARINALNGAVSLAWQQGDLPTARALVEESIRLCRAAGPPQHWNLALALTGAANIIMYQLERDTVLRSANEALALFRELGSGWGEGLSLCLVAEADLLWKDFDAAIAHFTEGLALLRRSGDRWATGIALMDLGYTNLLLGNLASARCQFEESIRLLSELGEKYVRAMTLGFYSQLLQQQGDFEQASSSYAESLDLMRKMGIAARIAEVQFNLAHFVQEHGYAAMAEKLYQDCLAIYTKQEDSQGIAKCRASLAAL